MPAYTLTHDSVHFRQTTLPRMFFVTLGALGVYITLTGSRMYPYSVKMSESEFQSVIELAREQE